MGDKIGGDKIGGDKIGGDKVGGNKGTTINAVNSTGVGQNVNMENVSINQQGAQLDLATLAQQLERLRASMKAEADPDNPDHDTEIGAIAAAQSAAKKGDESKVLSYLSQAGQWALDVAAKIGVTVATEAIKKSAGI